MMEYSQFIGNKSFSHVDAGFHATVENKNIFEFQSDLVKWACRRGRSAIFADTGLGKTIVQLEWAFQVQQKTDKPVIVLAPLCVAAQTVREGDKFGIDCIYIREPQFTNSRIHVTNYEMLKNFDPSKYGGIVLDESSILKGMNGSVRKQITEFASTIPYRLSCTATPSPNDYMELGTQSEFLGIMSQTEMLAMFFIHDMKDTAKWRLKGHGRFKFWEWLATWAMVIRNPNDLGYKASGYDLPPLIHYEHVVETSPSDELFVTPALGLQERNRARRDSIQARCELAASIANGVNGPCLIWCNLNDESALLTELIHDAVEVKGADKPDDKETRLLGFIDGDIQKLVTKPRIAGYGLNLQMCNHMVFVGLSDSWESYYQAIRRCWRFGQTDKVHVHIVCADTEGAVVSNIKRKEKQNIQMGEEMSMLVKEINLAEIRGSTIEKTEYNPLQEIKLPTFMEM